MHHPLTRNLLCHPASPCAVVRSISVATSFSESGDLTLLYQLIGQVDGIKLPVARPPGPADNLWQQTCCEAFVAAGDGESYREFNFSPSAQCASYQFASYRQRESQFQPHGAPRIALRQHAEGFELAATIPSALLPPGATLALAITTVIEANDGSKSYWALSHCAAQPDFHLRQSFTLALTRNTP